MPTVFYTGLGAFQRRKIGKNCEEVVVKRYDSPTRWSTLKQTH
jgi:hypothetical protein